jgi:hypothetical protein
MNASGLLNELSPQSTLVAENLPYKAVRALLWELKSSPPAVRFRDVPKEGEILGKVSN